MSPNAERDALNEHGVFLKKRVLHEIRKTQGMNVFAEEFGVAFNSATAVDIVAFDEREDRRLFFTFECKRAYTKQKTWVFFEDVDPAFRLCRAVSSFMQFGWYKHNLTISDLAICSEGYELVSDGKSCKADQKPIYDAGNQLCRGFLGFVSRRMGHQIPGRNQGREKLDLILPVLVTTAELKLAAFDVSQISLQSGNLDHDLTLASRDWLILKHPFAELSTSFPSQDFRKNSTHEGDFEHWRQQEKESLFVVNANKLAGFLSEGFRNHLDALRMQ